MSVKNLTLALSVACFCALIVTGCTAKPKLDLSNLQVNPSAVEETAENGGENGEGFVAGPTDGEAGDVTGFGTEDDDTVKGGEWNDGSQPVQPVNVGNLKNAQHWDGAVIYFAYNQSELEGSQRAKLDTLLAFLNENDGKGLIIEGHTDDRGSDEYNRALGERRSLSVKSYLVNCGIAENRIETVSYGEDRPAVPNASTESDHQLNRRCEFVIGDL